MSSSTFHTSWRAEIFPGIKQRSEESWSLMEVRCELTPVINERGIATLKMSVRTAADAAAPTSMATNSAEFERIFLPHLDAAHNLARFLLRSPEDAEDVVQESYLKALRAFSNFSGQSARPWL